MGTRIPASVALEADPGARHGDRRPPALLQAKLNPPSVAASQVQRTAVCAQVLAAPSAKLVLVRAPAGFGKTTAMAQLRRHMEDKGAATMWLTLDRGDNDVSRFLSCLEAAVSPVVSDDALNAAAFPSTSPGDTVLRLVDALAGCRAPFALFLDDFESVQDPVVLGLAREILAHLPPNGQMVVGSRNLPDLGLGRLRAHGQLLDIDAAQLRFSLQETEEFLKQRRKLPLQQEELSTLHQKTEGWIAALWLASLALERRPARAEFIARFSGSDQAVTQYLADDVLAQQPAALREFLLCTSILRHLEAPLCDALTGRDDSAELLRRLDAANIFLTPIEGEAPGYRYHGLFAGFLRGQLARERPGEAARLHRAASRWFELQERPVPAIDHAIDAGDSSAAVRLLARYAKDLLAQGRIRLLTRWFDVLPEAALQAHPGLLAVRAWALGLMRGPGEAMALLERCSHAHDAGAAASVAALRPVLLAMMDDYEQAYATGRIALSSVPAGETFFCTALTNAMADVFSVMGQYHEARSLLDAARRRQGQRADAFNAMYSEAVEGIIDLHEGRIRQAAARFRMAVRASHAGSHAHAHGNAWAGVLHANALYEANDCAQAEQLLNIYLPLATDAGLVDHMIGGHATLSRIAFQRGDVDQAFQVLTELEYLGHKRQLSRLVAGAKLERARVYILQGHLDAAKRELERADDRALWTRVKDLRLLAHDVEYLELGRIRWQIAAGQAADALPELGREIETALAASRNRRALKLCLLRALALDGSGDHRAAQAVLATVLREACNEGIVRLVVDEGPQVGALIRTGMAADGGRPKQRDPLFAEYLQRLSDAFGPHAASNAADCALSEPLTRQELRVLTLLAEGYSNSAIGEKLFVSANTVRTHLRGINAKFGASNRTQAVAMARRLGVIR